MMKKRIKNTLNTDFDSQIEEADFNRQHATGKKKSTDSSEDDFSVNIEFINNETEYLPPHHKLYKRKKPLTKKQKFIRTLITLIIILLILLVSLFIAFVLIRYKGEYSLLDYSKIELSSPSSMEQNVVLSDNGKTVEYNGKTYTFNPYITNILFMGVDQFELGSQMYGDSGQADAIYLLAYDTSNGECTLISISRDSMVDIDIYSSAGKYMGTKNQQLCLSFAYGDGDAASCENVITSVSRMFYGIPINSYFAIDISAISPLNDSIGGVTLTVLEDIPGMNKGETVTLMGADAVSYVRYRDSTILESNSMRLERQKQYLNSFAEKLIPSIKSNISVALDLYNTALDYTVTNIGTSRVAYLATIFADNNTTGFEIKSVEGEIIKGEYYAEFYPDETALYELILDTFYTVED